MFHMIHARDHDAATSLMRRAYRSVISPPEPDDQLEMELGQTAP